MSCAVDEQQNSYTITLDDDPVVAKLISLAIGIPSLGFSDNDSLLAKAAGLSPRAAFVDIHLDKGQSGLDLVPVLKKIWPSIPIIIITADSDCNAITDALSTGADDFIHKPIVPQELLARLQIRQRDVAAKAAQQQMQIGDLLIDLPHHSITGPRGVIHLSPTEMNLFMALVQSLDVLVPRSALKRSCWGRVTVSDSALDRKVHEVRKAVKFLSSTLEVKTVYGHGIILKQITETHLP